MVDRLSLLYEWSDNSVYTLKFLPGYSKALTAFGTDCFVFLLGVLAILKMSLKLTAVSFCTSVADIRRLENEKTMLLLKIRAGLIAGHAAGATVLTELFDAGFTDIIFVGASLPMQTGIERTFYFNLDMAFDFLGYRRWILSKYQPYCLKGQTVCDG